MDRGAIPYGRHGVAANGALPVLAPEVDQDDQVTKADAIVSSDAAVAVGQAVGGRDGLEWT